MEFTGPPGEGPTNGTTPDGAILLDLSDFRDFKIDRLHLLDPGTDLTCITDLSYGADDGQLLFVHVSEVPGGAYFLRCDTFTLDFSEPGREVGGCISQETTVARDITDVEPVQLRELFSAVQVESRMLGGPGCPAVATPCCTKYSWDGRAFTDHEDPGRLNVESELAILATLQSLAAQ